MAPSTSRNKRIPPNKQLACHSERSAKHEVELLRVERSEQAEARSESDEGIWLGVLVAFFHKCNIPLASHRDLQPYPASAKSLAVLHRIVAASGSLPQQNFDCALCAPLRMTYRGFVLRYTSAKANFHTLYNNRQGDLGLSKTGDF